MEVVIETRLTYDPSKFSVNLMILNPWHKLKKFKNYFLRKFVLNTWDCITAYSKGQSFRTESVTFNFDLLLTTS